MRGDFHAQCVRGLDHDAHFLVGHQLLARIVAGRGDAARRHHLDQVRAAAFVLAHAHARLVGRIDDDRSASLRARASDRARCADRYARRSARAVRAKPTGAARQCVPAAIASRTATVSSPPPTSRALVKPCCSICRVYKAASNARSISVVREPVLRRIRAARQLRGYVYMTIDETGQYGRLRQIDHARVGRRLEAVFDRDDPVVVDHDRHFMARRLRDAVDQGAGVNHEIFRAEVCRAGQGEHKCGAGSIGWNHEFSRMRMGGH